MEKSLFEQKISEYIQKEGMFGVSDRILVTLSGGADSVALLHSLVGLGYDCRACHCNFHLRGEESNRDEAFVRALVSRLGVQCEFIDFDVEGYRKENKVSVEVACRELRYEWFHNLKQSLGCSKIAVAHHADDDVETFFLNLLRGSGIAGLAGIKPINGDIVRPLLGVRRCDIENYLSEKGESFVVDSTNLENDYSRNKVRNIIMPAIRECFPNADGSIIKTLGNLYRGYLVYRKGVDNELLQIVTEEGDLTRIDLGKLYNSSEPETLLHEALSKYGFSNSQQSGMLTTVTVGARFSDGKFTVERRQKELLIWKNVEQADEFAFNLNGDFSDLPVCFDVEIIKNTENFKFEKNPNVAYFDSSILKENLQLRHWREGDRFSPFGMRGTKKLSDYFSDAKFTSYQKHNVWLLTEGEKILWLVGHRASSLFPVTKLTDRIVVLRVIWPK